MTAGHVTVMPRCLPVVKMIETGMDQDGAGVNRDKPRFTVAKVLKPVCLGGVPIHPGGVPVKPRFVTE